MVLRGVRGVHGGFWRGLGWSRGGLLHFCKALFAPLEVLYSTRFCSKHHIMVQLANVCKVDITGPFLDLRAPQGAPKGPFYEPIEPF